MRRTGALSRTPAQEWRRARPGRDAGWPVRLRFFFIAVALVFASWTGLRLTAGRVSFAWVLPLQSRVQTLAASLHGQAVATPPALAASQSPLSSTTFAQPIPTAAPKAAKTPVPVLVLVATPTPGPSATVAVADKASASPTARPSATVRATGSPTVEPRLTATPAINLSGPHATYIVQAGDTLIGIARRFSVPVATLATLNHLSPPYRITQGKPLLIPTA